MFGNGKMWPMQSGSAVVVIVIVVNIVIVIIVLSSLSIYSSPGHMVDACDLICGIYIGSLIIYYYNTILSSMGLYLACILLLL